MPAGMTAPASASWIDTAPRVEESGPGQAHDPDALIDAARPRVLRGLVAHWPAVAAAARGHAAMAAYLRRFDGGKPLGLFVGAPQIGGRFFYRPDLDGFNFERAQILLPVLLDALIGFVGVPDPPALYAGASTAADHFPGWVGENALPLRVDAALPRLWLGNRSRVSTHFDMASNIAAVVAGRRRFVLFPPEQAVNLYVGPLDTTMAGQPTSMVDLDRPDLARFPRFAAAQAAAYIADLDPGDALFIPALWWHEVRADGALTVLVNYWWTRGPPDSAFAALVHAILAIRDRPAAERAALRRWFDLYVFDDAAPDVAAHLPPAARGLLGGATPARDDRIRGYLRRMLGGD